MVECEGKSQVRKINVSLADCKLYHVNAANNTVLESEELDLGN